MSKNKYECNTPLDVIYRAQYILYLALIMSVVMEDGKYCRNNETEVVSNLAKCSVVHLKPSEL
jgi:hypothetical protein